MRSAGLFERRGLVASADHASCLRRDELRRKERRDLAVRGGRVNRMATGGRRKAKARRVKFVERHVVRQTAAASVIVHGRTAQ